VTEAQIQEWVYGPGIPAYAVLPSAQVFAPIDGARKSWLADSLATASLPARDWSTQEWLQFLNNLPAGLPRDKAAELDKTFALSKSRNAEIAMAWFLIAIRADYDPAYADLQRYLLSIGRRKLVRPLYEALMKTPKGAALARTTYSRARPGYHPITATSIDLIVNPKKS
jgi:leukotriene-A4 hydrolase